MTKPEQYQLLREDAAKIKKKLKPLFGPGKRFVEPPKEFKILIGEFEILLNQLHIYTDLQITGYPELYALMEIDDKMAIRFRELNKSISGNPVFGGADYDKFRSIIKDLRSLLKLHIAEYFEDGLPKS